MAIEYILAKEYWKDALAHPADIENWYRFIFCSNVVLHPEFALWLKQNDLSCRPWVVNKRSMMAAVILSFNRELSESETVEFKLRWAGDINE